MKQSDFCFLVTMIWVSHDDYINSVIWFMVGAWFLYKEYKRDKKCICKSVTDNGTYYICDKCGRRIKK